MLIWVVGYLLMGFFLLGIVIDPETVTRNEIIVLVTLWPVVLAAALGVAVKKLFNL